jgi:hypothetical protein
LSSHLSPKPKARLPHIINSKIMIKVLGIKITDRIKEAGITQSILSRHASFITTRLGFHELTNEVCSREAYIILHLSGEPSESEKLINELKDVGGIELGEMAFDNNKSIPEQQPGDYHIKIMGILVERNKDVILTVQKLLTAYGCIIRTRLGVNEIFFGEPAGLIILELTGDKSQMELMENDLRKIKQVHVRKILF